MGEAESESVAFAVHGPIRRGDLAGLCARVSRLLAESRATVALCDARGIAPDAVTVDALARLQLAARRHGCVVHLRNASVELQDLVAFMGLTDVLAPGPPLRGRAAAEDRTAEIACRSRGRT